MFNVTSFWAFKDHNTNFIVASGGTITFSGNYKIHTFTISDNFVVSAAPSGQTLEVLIVGGGGGGASYSGGGAGAGGLIYDASQSISVGTFPVIIGSGGLRAISPFAQPFNGNDSSFNGFTAIGGGCGGGGFAANGGNGGSGGGGGAFSGSKGLGTIGQGYDGANFGTNSGGGGGAGGTGYQGNDPLPFTSNGGVGLQYAISGTPTYYAGGGGGSRNSFSGGDGGLGGGGFGNVNNTTVNGVANTGGGGGGDWNDNPNLYGNGGSGIVIIRYLFQ